MNLPIYKIFHGACFKKNDQISIVYIGLYAVLLIGFQRVSSLKFYFNKPRVRNNIKELFKIFFQVKIPWGLSLKISQFKD